MLHNLYNFETVEQVQDYINYTLLKSLTFRITPTKYLFLEKDQSKIDENKNQYYYHENFEKQSIEHLILGREGSESGDYYNDSTLFFLRINATAETKVKKVPVIENVKKHLSSISNFIFEYPIPQDKIQYEKQNDKVQYQEGDSNSPGKIWVDTFDKQIILKKIATDSLGTSSFYGKAFNPNYNFYVVNSYKEIQTDLEKIKKFSSKDENSINSISDLEGKTIYVLEVELSGNVLDKKKDIDKKEDIDKKKVKPLFENSADGKIYLSLKGERSIYNDTALEESKKK